MKFEKDGDATVIMADDGTKIARIEVFGETYMYGLNRAHGEPPIAASTAYGYRDDGMQMVHAGSRENVRLRAPDSAIFVEVTVVRNHEGAGEGCVLSFVEKPADA